MDKTLVMLDIAFYLTSRQNYQQVKIRQEDNDLWLISNTNNKYPVVRITMNDLSDYKENKDRYLEDARRISKLFNKDNSLLSIHVSSDDADVYFEPDYYQGVISKEYASPIIKEAFPDIQLAILPQNLTFNEELEIRKKRIADYQRQLIAKHTNKNARGKKKFKFNAATVLILINFVFFLAATLLSMRTNDTFAAIFFGALYKPLVYASNEWWRLITSAFLHVDLLHLIVNMIALSSMALFVERAYGLKGFITIYTVSLLSGSLLSLVQMNSFQITLGASGAIYGLMGATVVYLFSSGLYKFKQFRQPIVQSLILNVFISFLPFVSWQAHLGGFIGGILATLLFTKTPIIKQTVISAYLSIALLIGGLFGYALFMDDNIRPFNKDLDLAIAYNYALVGFEDHAMNLIEDFNLYYNETGE